MSLSYVGSLQVRKHYMKELDKLLAEGAVISGKATEENDRLVEEIFAAEDKNGDKYISWAEFARPKHNAKNNRVEL